MDDNIYTPFTEEQVKNLNLYQQSGIFHEYTCGNDNHPEGKDRVLIATTDGWICPNCEYRQYWAMKSMSEPGIIDTINDWKKKYGLTENE